MAAARTRNRPSGRRPRRRTALAGLPAQPLAGKRFFGRGLPYVDISDLAGTLVVVEGSDGVGRSTQVGLLKNWLEVRGFGVAETGWTRSVLVGETIDLAKEGHAMNALTFNLLYATDLADRVEHEVIPALRSGFVVLADRYIYTAFARAAARRADNEWVRALYGFAVEPDIVFYLKIDTRTLIYRVLKSSGLDYWEAGMDQNPGCDPFDSFTRHQSKLIREFDRLAAEFSFKTVDARKEVSDIQREIRESVAGLLHIDFTEEDRMIGLK
ncbi:thymidylate kinase [bacterium]|nr:thymidylate kinase [bacterium]